MVIGINPTKYSCPNKSVNLTGGFGFARDLTGWDISLFDEAVKICKTEFAENHPRRIKENKFFSMGLEGK